MGQGTGSHGQLAAARRARERAAAARALAAPWAPAPLPPEWRSAPSSPWYPMALAAPPPLRPITTDESRQGGVARWWRSFRRVDLRVRVAAMTGAVALALLGAIGTVGAEASPSVRATTPTIDVPATATAATVPPVARPLRPGPVVVTVTGRGSAGTVTISLDGNRQSWHDVTLPATYHVSEPATGVSVTAEGGSDLACSMDLGGGWTIVGSASCAAGAIASG